MNGWRWTSGSFSKDCVSRKITPKRVKRGTDVNQDFLALNKSQKSLRILMFDGVSQSRAPRQWAETLAQTYAEMRLSIPELKKNGKRITQWQKKATERWNSYIENEYLPRRTHIPEWRLNNEVKTGHTTFISVEIHEKNIRLQTLGILRFSYLRRIQHCCTFPRRTTICSGQVTSLLNLAMMSMKWSSMMAN